MTDEEAIYDILFVSGKPFHTSLIPFLNNTLSIIWALVFYYLFRAVTTHYILILPIVAYPSGATNRY